MTKLSPSLEFVTPSQWRDQPRPDAAATFEQRCIQRAAMVRRGIIDRQQAADALQSAAEAFGLPDEIGQDRIQEIMGRAFKCTP
jgi:hypothetical protein